MPSSRSMRLCRFVCCESAFRVSGVPPEGVRAGLLELNDAEWVGYDDDDVGCGV